MTFLPRIPSNQLLFLLQLRKSNQKEAAVTKVLTAQKDLFYGRQPRCRCECIPSSSTQMTSRAASACHLPLNKPFCAETLNAGKAVAKPPERVSAKPILYSLTMDVLIIS
ncbi:MAG: hypothetical protein ACI8UG_001665 [Gammaproteobacteria bacterium]|jgi:hypothetical protein